MMDLVARDTSGELISRPLNLTYARSTRPSLGPLSRLPKPLPLKEPADATR